MAAFQPAPIITTAMVGEVGPPAHPRVRSGSPLKPATVGFEKAYFEFHLAREGGSDDPRCRKTGLERTHLYRKLRQLGVDWPRKTQLILGLGLPRQFLVYNLRFKIR